MSARRQPLLRVPRTFARRAVLLVAFAAAFLPTVIPGLHAGHGLPIAVAQASAHTAHVHHAATHDCDHEDDAPAAPSKRPELSACPICRTVQQFAAWTVPDAAVIEAPVALAISHAPSPVGALAVPLPFRSAQPRAPPVAA
jgi:hypothetical protein